jgi:DNA-binding response OmpR family regulator
MKIHKLIDILLVEDSDNDIEIIKDIFSELKLVNLIDIVTDGEEAVNYLTRKGSYRDKGSPGLVLLDINLPKKSGFEVLQEVKQNTALLHIPIIMLTTSKREEDIIKSYKYGACSYITKPFAFEELVDTMKQFAIYWAMISETPSHC